MRKLNFSEILAPLWPQTAWLLVKMSSQYTSHFSPYPSGIICNEVWFHITVHPPYPVAMPNATCVALHLMRSANLSLATSFPLPSLLPSPSQIHCIFMLLLSFGHWFKALILKGCLCSATFLVPCVINISHCPNIYTYALESVENPAVSCPLWQW